MSKGMHGGKGQRERIVDMYSVASLASAQQRDGYFACMRRNAVIGRPLHTAGEATAA